MQNKESMLRRALNKAGYSLRKSRQQFISINNLGGYMIVDTNHNAIVAGSRFELSLDDVAAFILE